MLRKQSIILLLLVPVVAIIAAFSTHAAILIESDTPITAPTSGCYDSDSGVYPYVAGYCVDYVGIKMYDAGLSANGGGLYAVGIYASETFCLTTEMRQYCRNFHSAQYCDGLPDNCYRVSLLPLSANLVYNYFPFKTEYLCTMGFKDGKCTVPVCGDGIINGNDQCDGINFGGKTCKSLTSGKFSAGRLSCTNGCRIDTSKCTVGLIWEN